MSFSAADHQFMSRALQLARHGLYTTDPNPRVGCVLVRGGAVGGEGFHARAIGLREPRPMSPWSLAPIPVGLVLAPMRWWKPGWPGLSRPWKTRIRR